MGKADTGYVEPIKRNSGFFTISPELVTFDEPLTYDIYINSSSIQTRERYVRIAKKDSVLTREDISTYITKYIRFFVSETERSIFLKSLYKAKNATAAQKATVLKDTAINHLQRLFEQELSTEVLGKVIVDCRDVIEGFIDVIGDYRVDQLQDLIGILSFHDFYTYDHSTNVSMYAILIYQALRPNAPRSEVVQAGLSGLLHDLGKIQISTQILNSTDKLTPEQFDEIKGHPGYGYDLLQNVKDSLPKDIQADLIGKVILQHHENYDGTGYPNKLAGNNIHVLSRVVTIADFFDAITTRRSYHEPLSFQEALNLMASTEGKKIDKQLFRFFVEHTQQMNIEKHLKKVIANDFDPCQPCKHIPIINIDPNIPAPACNIKPLGNVKQLPGVVEPKSSAPSKVKFVSEGPKKKKTA